MKKRKQQHPLKIQVLYLYLIWLDWLRFCVSFHSFARKIPVQHWLEKGSYQRLSLFLIKRIPSYFNWEQQIFLWKKDKYSIWNAKESISNSSQRVSLSSIRFFEYSLNLSPNSNIIHSFKPFFPYVQKSKTSSKRSKNSYNFVTYVNSKQQSAYSYSSCCCNWRRYLFVYCLLFFKLNSWKLGFLIIQLAALITRIGNWIFTVRAQISWWKLINILHWL